MATLLGIIAGFLAGIVVCGCTIFYAIEEVPKIRKSILTYCQECDY